MTRKKVKLAWIVNDSARKASLRKRRASLLKKVKELSILCDVDAFIIIYSRDDIEPMMWPSSLKVQEILANFNKMPEMERNKKMADQETYLTEMMRKLQHQFIMHYWKLKEMEGSNLMHHIYQGNGLDELNSTDLQSLVWFAEEKRTEIKKWLEYYQLAPLSHDSRPIVPHPYSSLAPAPAPIETQVLIPDQMATNIRANLGGSNFDHYEKAPGESAQWEQWFIDVMNTKNMAESSSGANTNHMAGLSDFSIVMEPHVGGNDGNEIALGLQYSKNFETDGNAIGGDMGLPSELLGGNIAARDVGLPCDVTEQWPINFNP